MLEILHITASFYQLSGFCQVNKTDAHTPAQQVAVVHLEFVRQRKKSCTNVRT